LRGNEIHHCSPIGMRCGNEAVAVVAISIDVSTHSADVAQNQPDIVVATGNPKVVRVES